MLLARDSDGKLSVHKEFEAAVERAMAYRTMRTDDV
jgi:hypothetical protein